MPDSIPSIFESLGSGLPVLLLHFGTTVVLLLLGTWVYTRITPFREGELIAEGNNAGGIVFLGSVIALAIPLAATLATSHVWLDILIWGLIALVLQLATYVAVVALFRDLRRLIESGNTAAATALVGLQIAVALLNAGAMAG